MSVVRRIVLLVLCLPFNLLVAWPVVFAFWALWGTNLRWEIAPTSGGLWALTCDFKPDSWPDRTWYRRWGATTLGHGIFYGSHIRKAGQWSPVQAHEHVHVEQFEGTMVAHAVLGLLQAALTPLSAYAWAIGLVTWFLGYLVFLLGGWLGALLRGESVYMGSAHEEAARAETGT